MLDFTRSLARRIRFVVNDPLSSQQSRIKWAWTDLPWRFDQALNYWLFNVLDVYLEFLEMESLRLAESLRAVIVAIESSSSVRYLMRLHYLKLHLY